jgi:hypothetical protein
VEFKNVLAYLQRCSLMGMCIHLTVLRFLTSERDVYMKLRLTRLSIRSNCKVLESYGRPQLSSLGVSLIMSGWMDTSRIVVSSRQKCECNKKYPLEKAPIVECLASRTHNYSQYLTVLRRNAKVSRTVT